MDAAAEAAAAASATAAAAAAAAAAANGAKPWHDGIDAETLGHLQNRGWEKMDAKDAALAAVKAHREAERHLGVPADKIIRLPKDAADVQGWTELRTKLGVPADGKYDFSSVKFADGSDLDQGFTDAISKALVDANVAKDRAPTVAQAVVKFMEEAEKTDAGEATAKIALEKDTLKANWGNNFNANMVVAKNTALALGATPEQVAALEGVIGYAKVMEMFRNIGTRTGEDTFVRSLAPGSDGVMSSEQAKATLAEKKADKVWTDKLMAGDTATKREFDNLTRVMSGA